MLPSSRDLRAGNPASKVISVQPVNTLTVTLKGQGGNHVTVKAFCNGCPPVQVRIDSPADGATITSPYSTIKGTVNATMESGVVVNGVMAQVVGNQFIANHVPLAEGVNTITAEATASYGGKARATIQVTGQPSAQYMTLAATPESGLSPLEITLKADTNLTNPIASASLTNTGPSAPTITTISPTEYKALMTAPGLYTYTLVVTDSQGQSYEDSIGVTALSKAEVDTLLRGKWDGMKGALAQGAVENALVYFAERSRDSYRQQFGALATALSQIIADMGTVAIINIKDNVAEYDLRTIRNGKTYSFQLKFVRDMDGIWRIRSF